MEAIKSMKEREKSLVEMGLKQGYLTFEQLAEELKGLDIDPDSLDELYNVLQENNITVVSEEEHDDNGEKANHVLLNDEEITKDVNINDPVRMYLKEIGRISLLSQSEELELSKRVAQGDEEAKNIPVGMKPIVSREPKKKLLDRFKEKWQNPSFRKKVIIGGVAVVLIGGAAIALAALNPDFVNSISQGLNYIGNNISHLFGNVPDTQTIPIENVSDVITSGNDISAVNTINAVQGIDMSNVSMEGLPIYNSAVDAANSLNPEVASQWASPNIQGLVDASTNQIVPLSPEDLQNFDKIQELVQNNQNLVPYTGNGELNTLNDVSGFFNVEDIVNHVGRSR